MPPPASAPVTVQTASVDVRLAFIRKVYVLLFINFAITIGVSCAFTFIDSVRSFIVQRTYLIWISIAVAIVALLFLACVPLKFPLNLIVMYIFVLSFSAMIGVIVARYYDAGWGGIVLQAFIATAAVFFSVTAFVFVTKIDFSFLRYFLFAGLVVLVVLSLFSFLVPFPRNGRSRWFVFGISVLGYVCPSHFFKRKRSLCSNRVSARARLLLFRDRLAFFAFATPVLRLYAEYVVLVFTNCELHFTSSERSVLLTVFRPPHAYLRAIASLFLPIRHQKGKLFTSDTYSTKATHKQRSDHNTTNINPPTL